ncbi:uncharacterized protein FOMMEDRAFT_20279 [Fomitiporia mediterranea MF3/22]|uniref:uncharacterized protein n=1 Tax=Fomitiporia mediterranea (strain MF3/22) TaxID=694068 RepID=UPI000440819C|nr:uncharacterized protein FOMMEDRAFT_20279 [Fomitiporia mediterranea MF3/22]EJD03118.1 hypothetical protein FOMMEDRAFT_20279 [Fomitiporia mediterranea MF3/22]
MSRWRGRYNEVITQCSMVQSLNNEGFSTRDPQVRSGGMTSYKSMNDSVPAGELRHGIRTRTKTKRTFQLHTSIGSS